MVRLSSFVKKFHHSGMIFWRSGIRSIRKQTPVFIGILFFLIKIPLFAEIPRLEEAIAVWKEGNLEETERLLDISFGSDPVAFRKDARAMKLRGLFRMNRGDEIRGEEDLRFAAVEGKDPILLFYAGMREAVLPGGGGLSLLLSALEDDDPLSEKQTVQALTAWHVFFCPGPKEATYPMERFNNPFLSRFFRASLWNKALHPLDRMNALFTALHLARAKKEQSLVRDLEARLQSSLGRLKSGESVSGGDPDFWMDPNPEQTGLCIARAKRILERTSRASEKSVIEQDILMLHRFRAIRFSRPEDLYSLGLATKEVSSFESLHAFRGALEKVGFYTISEDPNPEKLAAARETLFQLRDVYAKIQRPADATTMERLAETLVRFGGTAELTPELVRIATTNRHNRESLRFLAIHFRHDESGKGAAYEKQVRERDRSDGDAEFLFIFPDYP